MYLKTNWLRKARRFGRLSVGPAYDYLASLLFSLRSIGAPRVELRWDYCLNGQRSFDDGNSGIHSLRRHGGFPAGLDQANGGALRSVHEPSR